MSHDKITSVAPCGSANTGMGHGLIVTGRVLRLVPLLAIAASLASCVVSEKPLIGNAKPMLGPRFTVQLFRNFSDGRAHDLKTSVFEWKGGAYVNTGGSTMDLPRFVAQPLSDDFIIQSSNVGQKLFTYWIGRKVTDGAYLVIPLDEERLPGGARGAPCQKDSPVGFCVVETIAQLDEVARATARNPVKNGQVAIIVEDGLKAGADLKTVQQETSKGL